MQGEVRKQPYPIRRMRKAFQEAAMFDQGLEGGQSMNHRISCVGKAAAQWGVCDAGVQEHHRTDEDESGVGQVRGMPGTWGPGELIVCGSLGSPKTVSMHPQGGRSRKTCLKESKWQEEWQWRQGVGGTTQPRDWWEWEAKGKGKERAFWSQSVEVARHTLEKMMRPFPKQRRWTNWGSRVWI